MRQRLLWLIPTAIFLVTCHNHEDIKQLSAFQRDAEKHSRDLAEARKRISGLETEVDNLRKAAALPARDNVAALLNSSSIFCCRINSEFDAVLIGNINDEGQKLVRANLGVIRNGRIWPVTPHDEHWAPLGRYDAADGWPPDDATSVFWWVRPADRRVVSVTGISKDAENTAIVDFDWKWTLNAVGDALGRGALWMDDTYHARGTLRLFDDGWRVDRLSLGER